MTLLIINYVMDPKSQVLAWQTKVAVALAERFEKVIVLTHEKKNLFELPGNITILVFPNLFLRAPLRWLGGKYFLNFWIFYLHLKYHFDRAFVHMNFQWAYYFYAFFRITRIPLSIWYAHGSVSPELYRAHKVATQILSSTREGFRIPSNKLVLIGQSIDTNQFPLIQLKVISNQFIYVGRISPRKNIDKLIEVVDIIVKNKKIENCKLIIVGGALTEDDKKYEAELLLKVNLLNLKENIEFTGPLSHEQISEIYKSVFAHVSFSETGSMDKTLMEALSSGCPVLTSNEAMLPILEEQYHISSNNIDEAANRVCLMYNNQLKINGEQLRALVVNNHDVESYINKLVENIKKSVS